MPVGAPSELELPRAVSCLPSAPGTELQHWQEQQVLLSWSHLSSPGMGVWIRWGNEYGIWEVFLVGNGAREAQSKGAVVEKGQGINWKGVGDRMGGLGWNFEGS